MLRSIDDSELASGPGFPIGSGLSEHRDAPAVFCPKSLTSSEVSDVLMKTLLRVFRVEGFLAEAIIFIRANNFVHAASSGVAILESLLDPYSRTVSVLKHRRALHTADK